MNILVITQLYPQPDDVGDNKPTRTVEYFAKEWVKSGNKVIVAHCPSRFPFIFYLIPPQNFFLILALLHLLHPLNPFLLLF